MLLASRSGLVEEIAIEMFHLYGVHLSSSLLMQFSVGWQGYVTMETIWKNTGGFVYD